ncbi:hypothetical protein Efla_007670 [Eimeria flavescens]
MARKPERLGVLDAAAEAPAADPRAVRFSEERLQQVLLSQQQQQQQQREMPSPSSTPRSQAASPSSGHSEEQSASSWWNIGFAAVAAAAAAAVTGSDSSQSVSPPAAAAGDDAAGAPAAAAAAGAAAAAKAAGELTAAAGEEQQDAAAAEGGEGGKKEGPRVRFDAAAEAGDSSSSRQRQDSVSRMGFVELVENLLLTHDVSGAPNFRSASISTELSEVDSEVESLAAAQVDEDEEATDWKWEAEEITAFADQIHSKMKDQIEQEAALLGAALKRSAAVMSGALAIADDTKMLIKEGRLAGLGLSPVDDEEQATLRRFDLSTLLTLTSHNYEKWLHGLCSQQQQPVLSGRSTRRRSNRSPLFAMHRELARLGSTSSEDSESSSSGSSEEENERSSSSSSRHPASAADSSSKSALTVELPVPEKQGAPALPAGVPRLQLGGPSSSADRGAPKGTPLGATVSEGSTKEETMSEGRQHAGGGAPLTAAEGKGPPTNSDRGAPDRASAQKLSAADARGSQGAPATASQKETESGGPPADEASPKGGSADKEAPPPADASAAAATAAAAAGAAAAGQEGRSSGRGSSPLGPSSPRLERGAPGQPPSSGAAPSSEGAPTQRASTDKGVLDGAPARQQALSGKQHQLRRKRPRRRSDHLKGAPQGTPQGGCPLGSLRQPQMQQEIQRQLQQQSSAPSHRRRMRKAAATAAARRAAASKRKKGQQQRRPLRPREAIEAVWASEPSARRKATA